MVVPGTGCIELDKAATLQILVGSACGDQMMDNDQHGVSNANGSFLFTATGEQVMVYRYSWCAMLPRTPP